MKNEKVHLTFPTDRETAFLLKEIAHMMGKTQPELLNEISKDFIEKVMNYLDQKYKEQTEAGE